MFGLAVATSIDALVVGVTLPMLHAPMLLTIVTIGVVTALLSALGLAPWKAHRRTRRKPTRCRWRDRAHPLGASILIEHFTLEG